MRDFRHFQGFFYNKGLNRLESYYKAEAIMSKSLWFSECQIQRNTSAKQYKGAVLSEAEASIVISEFFEQYLLKCKMIFSLVLAYVKLISSIRYIYS